MRNSTAKKRVCWRWLFEIDGLFGNDSNKTSTDIARHNHCLACAPRGLIRRSLSIFRGKKALAKFLGKIQRGFVSRRQHRKSRVLGRSFSSKARQRREVHTAPSLDMMEGLLIQILRFALAFNINLHRWPKKIQARLASLPRLKRPNVQHFPSFFPTFLLILRSKIAQHRRETFPKVRWRQKEPSEAIAQEANTRKSLDQPLLDVWELFYLHTRWSEFDCIM